MARVAAVCNEAGAVNSSSHISTFVLVWHIPALNGCV
jgi:hypothetical protein